VQQCSTKLLFWYVRVSIGHAHRHTHRHAHACTTRTRHTHTPHTKHPPSRKVAGWQEIHFNQVASYLLLSSKHLENEWSVSHELHHVVATGEGDPTRFSKVASDRVAGQVAPWSYSRADCPNGLSCYCVLLSCESVHRAHTQRHKHTCMHHTHKTYTPTTH